MDAATSLRVGLLGLALAVVLPLRAASPFPPDHRQLRAGIQFQDAIDFLKSAEKPGFITLSEIGRSAGGRPIHMLRLRHEESKAKFRVLFFAQQHGNEVSGKDALLYLVRTIAEDPKLLPEDVDLYIVPSLNPDGWVSNQRRNGAGVDLNRDHTRLSQPETQALYRVVRSLQPHLAMDGHEFTRDSEEYTSRGWSEWPLIMMDSLNHPLIPRSLRETGLATVESANPRMQKKGHAYLRYTVGDAPPDGEIRPSTPDADDGRNGIGSHGVLSFIIEAGITRGAVEPQADLGQRVDAYLELYWHLLGGSDFLARSLEKVEWARKEPLPAFIPRNLFWGKVEPTSTRVKVVEASSGRILEIPAGNLLTDLVVKSSIPTPRAYAIDARAAAIFKPLLDRHGLRFEVLQAPTKLRVEECRLIRVEEAYDEIYGRYGGRQIVTRKAAQERMLPTGTILVSLDQPLARRAIQILEPCMLYGLFQYKEFRALVGSDQVLPLQRVR